MKASQLAETIRRCLCRPNRWLRWVCYGLIAVGVILIVCFVPIEFWLVALGVVFVVLGILLLL